MSFRSKEDLEANLIEVMKVRFDHMVIELETTWADFDDEVVEEWMSDYCVMNGYKSPSGTERRDMKTVADFASYCWNQ